MCNVSVCQMKIAIRLNCMAKQQKQNNEKKQKQQNLRVLLKFAAVLWTKFNWKNLKMKKEPE